MLNMDNQTLLTTFHQFIKIVHLGLYVFFEDLESVSLNFIGGNLAFQILVAAFLKGLNETSVHLE